MVGITVYAISAFLLLYNTHHIKTVMQGIWMKDIQNKIIISQKSFIIHIFSEYITFSVTFNVGSFGGTTNIQTIFDLIPHSLKHVWCYRSHSIPYAGFQVLKVIELNLADSVLHITPKEKIQWGEIWRPRRPSNWSTSADPSPSHLSVQVIPNTVAEMWQCPILFEDSLRW
jgi:hypothetical protein